MDGSWQRRGFSSTDGVVTTISVNTGKIQDREVMSRNCKACNKMKTCRKDDPIR